MAFGFDLPVSDAKERSTWAVAAELDQKGALFIYFTRKCALSDIMFDHMTVFQVCNWLEVT